MRCSGMSYTVLLLPLCASYVVYEVRRCVSGCCIGCVKTVVVRPLLLLCTSQTHVHRGYRLKVESLEHGCRCIATAVLLCDDFVAAMLTGCFCLVNKKIAALRYRLVCL